MKVHHFESLQIILCKENPSPCSTIEPLYCSSFATTVGGIRIINFVDSGTPTVHESNGVVAGDGALVKVRS